MLQKHYFDLPFSPKPIPCVISASAETSSVTSSTPKPPALKQDVAARSKKKVPITTPIPSPALIFTHGSSGTLFSLAIEKFATGFAAHLPILCFQGNLNLNSRIKMFDAVISVHGHQCSCLGGRSMGARAATMSAAAQVPAMTTTLLVLVSYPMHTTGQGTIRDQILISLPPSMKVIFVSGDRDSMCDLERLEEVRAKMACKSWRVVILGADHGMKLRSPNASKADEVVQKSGEVVAAWIKESDEGKREGQIFLNELGGLHWSGWCSELSSQRDEDNETDKNIVGESSVIAKSQKALKRRKSAKLNDGESAVGEKIIKKSRKR